MSASEVATTSFERARHDAAQRWVARLAEDLRTHDQGGHRRLEHVVAGRAEALDADPCPVGRRLDAAGVREVRQVEERGDRAASVPPCPSEVSAPAKTRSKVRVRRVAASTSAVARAQEPGSASSTTWTARVAPIASPLRSASAAPVGPMVRSVTSPPCASISLSAASSTYSSLPLASSPAARSTRCPSVSRSLPTMGTALTRTTMCTLALSRCAAQPPCARTSRPMTRRWICWVPS